MILWISRKIDRIESPFKLGSMNETESFAEHYVGVHEENTWYYQISREAMPFMPLSNVYEVDN